MLTPLTPPGAIEITVNLCLLVTFLSNYLEFSHHTWMLTWPGIVQLKNISNNHLSRHCHGPVITFSREEKYKNSPSLDGYWTMKLWVLMVMGGTVQVSNPCSS